MNRTKIKARAIGGPGHGRTFAAPEDQALNMAPMRPPSPLIPTPAHQWDWKRDGQDAIIPETYWLRRFTHPHWAVPLPLWLHASLLVGGEPMVPSRLLPEILRGHAYPACSIEMAPLWAVRRRAAA